MKFKIFMIECAKCKGAHASWWKSTPPPSCAERQRGLGRNR